LGTEDLSGGGADSRIAFRTSDSATAAATAAITNAAITKTTVLPLMVFSVKTYAPAQLHHEIEA